MDEANNLIGTAEIKGKDTNLKIKSWLSRLRAWWSDDETPWCGTFVAHCLQINGYPIVKEWYRAKSWLEYGVRLDAPCYGCLVIFNRTGGGHVGFCVGRDNRGRLLVLGGNQGDKVSIAPFEMSRVSGYRMPVGVLSRMPLPLVASSAASSTNEA